MRGSDELAALVQAYRFQLISPSTGLVVAELAEPVAGVASLQLGNPGTDGGSILWTEAGAGNLQLFGPGPPATAGNPPNVILGTDGLSLFSGGGLGVIGADLTLEHTAVTATATLGVDNGTGTMTDSVQVTPGFVNLKPSTELRVNGARALTLKRTSYADCTANLALAAAYATLPGCSIGPLNLTAGDICFMWGVADVRNAGAISFAALQLTVNGGALVGNAVHSVGAGGASSIGRPWRYSIPATGNYTFALQGAQTGGAWTAQANNSNLTLQVFSSL